MIKVGLTGGMGSGKTTAARQFEKLGIPVYYADNRAKELMIKKDKIKEELIRTFGKEVYKNKRLDTKYLASKVFNDKKELKKLENIVHPAVRKDFITWAKKQKSPYVIVENAILHKSGMDKLMDYIIFVTADKNTRIKRVKNRDGLTKKEIENRMNNQENEDFFMNNSDFIIKNNENIDSLEKKVKMLDKKLKILLKKS